MTKIRRRKAPDDENLNSSSSWNKRDDPTLLVFAAIIIVVVLIIKYDVDGPPRLHDSDLGSEKRDSRLTHRLQSSQNKMMIFIQSSLCFNSDFFLLE